MAWNVKIFQTSNGKYPVKEFIQKQDEVTQAKIAHSILLLKNNGPFLKPPFIKKLQSGVYELRIQGKNALRILYTMYNNEYYLVHAFKKKTQKMPQSEIKTAVDRIKELI